MKTTDFDAKVTAKHLNENMFKKFGTKVNLEKYTRQELENYRNILRTKVHQVESSSKFNELLSNENYQRDKHLLDVLNTKIKEMLGEGAKVDRQAAHITKSMMKKGKTKDEAEAIAWSHIKHPKNKKKAEEGIEETTMKTTEAKKKGDGNLANNYPPYDKVTRGDVIAGRLGKDEKGGKKVKEASAKCNHTEEGDKCPVHGLKECGMYEADERPASQVTTRMVKMKKQGGGEVEVPHRTVKGWQTQKADKAAKADKKSQDRDLEEGLPMVKGPNGKMVPAFAADGKGKKDLKKKMKEDVFRLHVRLVNESLKYLIMEDEEGKAKTITAASDMVNDFTTWMQRVGQYQTKAIVELADAIRADFGEQEAESFKQAVSPALTSTLDTLTQQREAISHAVAVLAGEATDVAPMGQEPGMGEPPMDGEIPSEVDDDSMNPPEDEFAASDAAAGGAETAGREIRESKLARIFESHSIISKLAR